MAYVAVVSLKHTIHRLLDSSRISILPSTREILQFAYHEVEYLQQVLKRSDDSSCSSKRLTALDEQIKEAVHNLENSLEFHLSKHFLSQSAHVAIDMEEVKSEISSFVDTMKEMEEEFIKELDNSDEEDDDDEAYVPSSSFDFGVKNVGLSDDFNKIKARVLRRTRPYDFVVYPIIGRIGTGRLLIARALFEDLFIGQEQTFDCGAWVTVGPNYRLKEILLNIVAQVDPDRSQDLHILSEGDDEQKIVEVMFASLMDRKYMIVLDDVRDEEFFDYLKLFPKQDNGSLILLTTDLQAASEPETVPFSMQLNDFDQNYVWDTLEFLTFGLTKSVCPSELEKDGKRIAENCQGRHIALIKVSLHLWKAEKTPEYWSNLATDNKNSIFVVDDELSEICQIREEMRQLRSLNLEANQISCFVNFISEFLDVYTVIVKEIKMELFPERCFPKMEIISIYGMAGIGKTTLVKTIFEDPLIMQNIDHRVWITLGPKYQPEEILVDILAQIYPDIDRRHMNSDIELTKDLCRKLSCKRCLIALDDMWGKEPLDHLEKLFTDIKGKALVTTRLAKVARFEKFGEVHEMHLLDIEESWNLFCQKVFDDGWCPPKLEKVGKKICKKCEGLPLLILMVADLLSRDEKTLEHWIKIADQERNPIFTEALNEISKVLIPSYRSLPQYQKACFLFMGVFPHDFEIITSNLIALLISEGFLEPNPYQNAEDYIAECLSELANNSVIIVCQKGSNSKIKAYRLHYVFWHLSNNKAMKTGFFYSLSTFADDSIECITSQRRLCIRNNILLGLEDIQNSMTSASNAHSLICTGPLHQYQVPICFNMRLLRVLDAFTIRIYEFPVEVVKLIHLRYLALTCSGKIPASISKLLNLQYLIISRYLSIKSTKDSSYLPVEIWDMKELKHLQIAGGYLPSPHNDSTLPSLVTLLDVSAHSCTENVFTSVPNLKKLGIQIVLSPDHDEGTLFHCLDHIFLLQRLESLKCNVVNPELRLKVVVPFTLHSMFPCIKKLSLSGLGYPWVYMSIIGQLPNLEILKLRYFAFQGPKWEVDYKNFGQLKFLSIEDTDLECWELKSGSFQNLEHLSIKHCYKLRKLPHYFHYSLKVIEIVDCNPTTENWVNRLKLENKLETRKVHSSWNADELEQL